MHVRLIKCFLLTVLIASAGCDAKTTNTDSCGDGFLDPGEACDGDQLSMPTCEALGYYTASGPLVCKADCTLDTSMCALRCGDGVASTQFDEDCDGSDLADQTCLGLGLGEGTLSCDTGCRFDTSGCQDPARCGDGTVTAPLEQCEAGDLAGQTCETLGYYGGVLTCDDGCRFDLSSCESFGRCGDSFIQTQYGELCEGGDLGGQSCESLGFHAGTLLCTTGCQHDTTSCEAAGRCGDGAIQDAFDEACDGEALDGQTCESLGYHGGALACTALCALDLSACEAVGRCGDDAIQDAFGEACDGTDLDGQSCESLGYHGGTLACTTGCELDLSACEAVGRCGDGVIQAAHEQCEGDDLDGRTCPGLGLYDGTLACTSDCRLDTTGCGGSCGDGLIQTAFGEVCDGTDVNSQTCESQGHHPGTLVCDACQFDLDGCGGFCGDGILQTTFGEVCEGANLYGHTCPDLGAFFGVPACSLTCVLAAGSCSTTYMWGNTSSDVSFGVAIDAVGNIYVVGATAAALDGQTFAGVADAFLTKFSPTGVKLWTRQWGTASEDIARGVAVAADGTVYVTGHTAGALDGQTYLGVVDIFLTKFDTDGNKVWTRQWGSAQAEIGHGVAVDGSGFIYVTGMTNHSMEGQTAIGAMDFFLTRLDATGARLWTRLWGTTNDDMGRGVTVDAAGNAYVAGYSYDGVMYHEASLRSYTSAGGHRWTQTWGDGGMVWGLAVAMDGAGHVVMGGLAYQASSPGVFVARYTTGGVFSWSQRLPVQTSVDTSGMGIAVSGTTLSFTGTVTGAIDSVTPIGGLDIFLARFTTAGVKLGVSLFGTTTNDGARSLAVDADGHVFITGGTAGTLDGQPNAGSGDVFLKYVP